MTSKFQSFDCGITELVSSIAIMLIAFLSCIAILIFIKNSNIANDTCLAVIYFTGIFYLYKKAPINFSVEVHKPLLFRYTAVGLAAFSILYIQYYFRTEHSQLPEMFTCLYGYNTFEIVIYLILGCIVIPVNEELLFRYYFYNIVKNKYGICLGAIVSIFLFTAVHAFQSSVNISNILLQGIVYTHVYEKSKSVFSSIGAHVFNNSMWFFMTYLLTLHK